MVLACACFLLHSFGALGCEIVQANWNDVWKMALAVFSHQRIEVQILIGLLAAFAGLMLIEGLRANFFRRSAHAAAAIAEPEEQIVFIPREPPQAIAPEIAPVQPFAARRLAIAHNPKRKSADVRRHKPMRPIIRRMANGETLSDQEMTA